MFKENSLKKIKTKTIKSIYHTLGSIQNLTVNIFDKSGE